MIREGKEAGWLNLPTAALSQWAELNNVVLAETVKIGPVPGAEHRGSAVLATAPIQATEHNSKELMTIPRDLILSVERVHEHAKYDQDFRAVLDAIGDFGNTPRGAILTFLLFQSFISHPTSIANKYGVKSAFSDYIKFLPLNNLPTSWSDSDLALARTTTLYPATKAKLASLQREFDNLKSATESIPFCALHWWPEPAGLITFDDWLQVDAMYRSRALDFPGIGHCMVPTLDMCNHASGESTNAVYETTTAEDAVLYLRPGHSLSAGQEVTITYGDDKGACEMLFSYGFIEDSMTTKGAKELFLSLHLFENDPLYKPKLALSGGLVPGVKLSILNGDSPDPVSISGSDPISKSDPVSTRFSWTSDFIWVIIASAEDGLNFRIRQTTSGKTDLVAFWNDTELSIVQESKPEPEHERQVPTASHQEDRQVAKEQQKPPLANLEHILRSSEMWDIYHLRAVSVLQDRVAELLSGFVASEEEFEKFSDNTVYTSLTPPQRSAIRLRELEYELAGAAYGYLEDQKNELAQKENVKRYLMVMSAGGTGDGSQDDSDENAALR